MEEKLIAPCGINCAICRGYLREEDRCLGCMVEHNSDRVKDLEKCTIRMCEKRRESDSVYCIDCCDGMPCDMLNRLEERYSTRNDVSPIENMRMIKQKGMEAFLKKEEAKWKCAHCGAVLSMHEDACIKCGTPYREPYREI